MAIAVAARLARSIPFYYGWVVLGAAGSAVFARNAASSLALAVFIYPISQDLGWSRALIAGAASLGGLAASAASPLVGWLVDRYGARVVLAVSVLILGLSTLSLAWAVVPLAFYLAYGAGRVIFSSPLQIASSVAVSRWFTRRRGRATGILFVAHSAGMVTFPLLAALLISWRDWPQAWLALGLLVWLAALAPTALLVIERPEDIGLRPDGDAAPAQGAPAAVPEPAWTLRQAVKTPVLWLLAVAGGAVFLVQSGVNLHQGAYFRDQGLGAGVATLAITANALATGAGSLLWGWAIERVAARRVYALVALTMAAASALFLAADTALLAVGSAALFGAGIGGILAVPPVAFADYFGRSSLGAIRGVTEPFSSLGQAIGALLSGLIFDATRSYHMAFVIFAALSVLTAAMLLLAKPPRSFPKE